MAGTNIFVLTERVLKMLHTRGMDLRCKCVKPDGSTCNALLDVHDTVVSKPAKHGRKYYLLSHFNNMLIDIPNGNNNENGEYLLEETMPKEFGFKCRRPMVSPYRFGGGYCSKCTRAYTFLELYILLCKQRREGRLGGGIRCPHCGSSIRLSSRHTDEVAMFWEFVDYFEKEKVVWLEFDPDKIPEIIEKIKQLKKEEVYLVEKRK